MSLALLLAAAPALADAPLPIRFLGDEDLVVDLPSDDVFGMGQDVKVRGAIADNAFLMGEDIVIDAAVEGDLFAMASEVRIEAPVHGDVYALAGEVFVGSSGSVAGHVHALTGDLHLKGPVGGNVQAGAGQVTLEAPVAGDVNLEVGQLDVRSGAWIGGDLDYAAPARASGLDGLVAGTVTFTEQADTELEIEEEEEEQGSILGSMVSWTAFKVWGYASKLIVGFVLLALGGVATSRAGRTLVDQPARSLGLGFTVSSVLLLGSLVALVLVIPFPLGLVGLVVLGLALYLGQLVSAQALGDWLLKRFRPDAWGSPYLSMAIGLVPLVLVYSLPWVGNLAWFVATVFGLGAMWLHLRALAKA